MAQRNLHLSEKQTLLPGVVLSMRLLSMDLVSLSEYIKEKSLENPVIEVSEPGSALSFDAEDYSGIAAPQSSLEQYVCGCIGETGVKKEIALVAEYLASYLDPDGYLDLEGVPQLPYMDEAIELIQSFPPAGIGARNLPECLIIQLKQKGSLTPELEFICKYCLEDISKYKTAEIARRIGKSKEETLELINAVKALNPKPAAHLGNQQVVNIIPDIKVLEIGDELTAVINDSAMPAVNMVKYELDKAVRDSTVSSYIRDKEHEARSLIHAMDYRKTTLLSVARDIVDIQGEAFRHGRGSMKPLRMKDTAQRLNLSPSTVSRACAEKYLEYRGRVYPFSAFFASVLPGKYGDVSSEMIRSVIARIIADEDPARPLPDSGICEELELSGFEISRRTVAKYRGMMNIPSSNERRRKNAEV